MKMFYNLKLRNNWFPHFSPLFHSSFFLIFLPLFFLNIIFISNVLLLAWPRKNIILFADSKPLSSPFLTGSGRWVVFQSPLPGFPSRDHSRKVMGRTPRFAESADFVRGASRAGAEHACTHGILFWNLFPSEFNKRKNTPYSNRIQKRLLNY